MSNFKASPKSPVRTTTAVTKLKFIVNIVQVWEMVRGVLSKNASQQICHAGEEWCSTGEYSSEENPSGMLKKWQ